jgi:hypothetical protein
MPDPRTCTAEVRYAAPSVTDNFPGATVACSPPSGSAFELGTTLVTCEAVDQSGNSSSCVFRVTVAGGPRAELSCDGDGNTLRFKAAKARRKPRRKPEGRECRIRNAGCGRLEVRFRAIERVGPDVDDGTITNPDDRRLFELRRIDPDRPGDPGTIIPAGEDSAPLPIEAGREIVFRVRYSPIIPAVSDRVTDLSAREVLPDVVTSRLRIETSDGQGELIVNLTGRVATLVQLIHPRDSSLKPLVLFQKNGETARVEFSGYDANLDPDNVTYMATFQFLDSSGGEFGLPVTVDITGALRGRGLVRGQTFTVAQNFTRVRNKIAGVRVTISDDEGASNPGMSSRR